MLQKQSLPLNFSQGLDTKTDKFQVQAGKFLALSNSIFDKGGMLQKRNGYAALSALPNTMSHYLTTFNGNLTAIGSGLQAYAQSSNTWVSKGNIIPAKLSTLSSVRSSTNQSQSDSILHPNGYIMTVFTDNVPVSGTNIPVYKFQVSESVTGQNIIAPQAIPVPSGAVAGSPRCFVLRNYFIILVPVLISSVYHLQYIAVNTNNPTLMTVATDITNQLDYFSSVNYDAVIVNNSLYIAFNASDGTIKFKYLTSTLSLSNTVSIASQVANVITLCADITSTTPKIFITWSRSSSLTIFTVAYSPSLQQLCTVTTVQVAGLAPVNLASVAQNGVETIFVEIPAVLTYDSGTAYHDLYHISATLPVVVTDPCTIGSATTMAIGSGLASKAVLVNGIPYVLSSYQSPLQSSYFLMNQAGNVVVKLAYGNGVGYVMNGLPALNLLNNNELSVSYLFADQVQSVTKNTNKPNLPQVYAQFGINEASITIGNVGVSTAEIGKNLNISGGFITAYDGVSLTEQGFFLFPEFVKATPSTTGGTVPGTQLYYQVTYERADNQGNLLRSAPSIPLNVITTGSTSSVVLNVPTLQLTYATDIPIKIVIYRWSNTQQVYHQITSIVTPLLNDPSVDSVSFTDTLADAAIQGNNILYTTGGVLENISPPASNILALFDTRLFLVSSEDPNLLWYSKPVIENTPVEMSDLLTLYVAPTASAQGSTGPITALAALDDKLIIFKNNAIYYLNGVGPDITGSNSQYSQPVFITSTVGCNDPNSIVFMPNGLMFESDKGIWLLKRDLSTDYIGAPVQDLTTGTNVLSAINVPATNQVRFTLDSGITLMYDYYYGQWGTFTNVPAISSTLYQNLHTYLDSFGRVFQETPGVYLDNTKPVLMSFTTSWINLAGIQGLERFYSMYLLGVYYTPFKLNVEIAYDYNPSAQQSTIITPDNYSPNYGLDAVWGSGETYGGPGNRFEAQVFSEQQKVESFRVTITEQYNPAYAQPAGAGLTLSGINIIYGIKKNSRNSNASRSFG